VHGDKIFARMTGDYTHDMSNPRGGHREIPGQLTGAPVLPNVFDTQAGLTSPKQDVKAWGWSLFMEAKPLDWLTLRSITAYRKDDPPRPSISTPPRRRTSTYPPITATARPARSCRFWCQGRFNGMAGFYYLNATALTQFDVRLFTTVSG
jgi:iron complex outermembrane receptor protein